MPRIKPGASGLEARLLPLCYAALQIKKISYTDATDQIESNLLYRKLMPNLGGSRAPLSEVIV